MTTIAYCHETKLLAADTRITVNDYPGYCQKILFPKKGVIVATAGDAGEGEWLRLQLAKITNIKELYFLEDKPKMKDLRAFIWWKGTPYGLLDSLLPFPIESKFFTCGTGGDLVLAYLALGMPIHEAMLRAVKLDINSAAPIHVVDCSKSEKLLLTYTEIQDQPKSEVVSIPNTIEPETNSKSI
jgi:hypothetical protein